MLASAALLGALVTPASAEERSRPNVVVIVLDTARRDHFSTYGYERETTPVFTRLAEESVRFDRAYSTSCWTVPAHASLFTGLYPVAHGANQESQYLSDDATTLAEVLADDGYGTAVFSGNPWVSPQANLVQGFEKVEVTFGGMNQPKGTGLPHPLNRKVLRWLDTRDGSRPFFLFVNYIEAHWRYQAPAELQRKFVPGGKEISQDDEAMFTTNRWYLRPDKVRRDLFPVRTGMYDADLAYADAVLGELLEGLRARGLMEKSVVIVTADHGENHGDRGHLGHMFALTEATIRIPLAVRLPGGEGAGAVRTDPVQLVDLFPTVLSLAGAGLPEDERGRDLFAGPVPEDRPIFTEYYYPEQVLGFLPEKAPENDHVKPFLRRIRSVEVEGHKLIWGSDGRHRLFDLNVDPREEHDRFADDPERAAALEARLLQLVDRYGASAVSAEDVEIPRDPAVEEQLRALGYVQ